MLVGMIQQRGGIHDAGGKQENRGSGGLESVKGVRIWGTQQHEPQAGAPITAAKKDEVLGLIQSERR